MPELLLERTWRGTAEEVWALISNTDAFNRAAGLGLHFERDSDGWRGRQSLGPLEVTWREDPIQFMAPRRFESRREYASGPIASAFTECDLEETEQGTHVRYHVVLETRGLASWLGPIVMMVLRGKLQAGLDAVERALNGTARFDPPPALAPPARELVQHGMAHLDPGFRAAIVERLENAPLVVQQQLRPLRIAQSDGLDPDAFVRACLAAVQAEVLELRWQLLCPRCGGGGQLAILELATRDVHCETCDIRYDAALADNVEAVFRPAPGIRDAHVPVDCVMSPSHIPRVVAQLGVRAQGELKWETPLVTGCYRMEHGGHAALIDVNESHGAGGSTGMAVLELRDDGFFPSVVRVAPGPTTFIVRNRVDRVAQVALSKRWRPFDALTASRLLTRPALRNALPVAVLADGLDLRTYKGAGLAIEGDPDDLLKLRERTADRDWTWYHLGNRVIALGLPSAAEALSTAELLVSLHLPVGMGLAEGLVLELAREGNVTLCGQAIEHALEALRRVGVPQVAIDPRSTAAFTSAATAAKVHVHARGDQPALVAFASLLDGAPPPPPEEAVDEGLPESVAGFPVLKELDRGGMGRVLEVLDPATGQRLAIKQMLPGFASDRALQLFFREAFYAVQIKHPNVVDFRDWGIEQGRPYLVMEVLVGRSLETHLEREGRMDRKRVRDILVAVLDALQAIHGVGLVHRDIKPHNIFVLADPKLAPGGVKLLDFGLMRRAGHSRTEVFAGTPDYVAPEQLLLGAVDARTDLFSVAMVAHRMLTGKLPFTGRTVGQRAIKRLDDHTEPLLETEALGALAPLLVKALSPDPERRYPSAEAMRDALAGVDP
ncbi:MAG: protein kinase [Myxococcota bacterium]